MLTSRINPDFEARKEALCKVARCTSIIGTYSDDFATGTGFFVGPSTLLTAKHVAPEKNVRVVAQIPGARTGLIDDGILLDENVSQDMIVCEVVPDDSVSLVDITILDCSKSTFRATEWLDLDQTILKKSMKVDLIGYPGDYTLTYARQTQGIDPKSEKSEYRDIEDLLPRYELTITHGTVIRGGGTPSYRVSTIAGMSGSPIIVNGKAVGIIYRYLFDIVGVHTGCNKTGNNRGVAFSNVHAWKLLKDYGIRNTYV
jgi:V8-like Glu-specific endopeptidase